MALLGTLAARIERLMYPPDPGDGSARPRGTAFTAVIVGGTAIAVRAAEHLASRRPGTGVVLTATVVWAALGGTSLLRIGTRQAGLLEAADVDGSRGLLPWLCGRDPSDLDAGQLARAVIESLAENTSDAMVATLFWAAVAGPAGAATHRAANTLDAMVGHRSDRYRAFGWASARLDDVLGWPAARLGGVLIVALAPTVGGHPAGAARAWFRDSGRHPSWNAGVVEASCAGALGIRLGGTTPYPYGVEERPVMGDGRAPQPADIRRAVRLLRRVQLGATIVVVAACVLPTVVAGSAARRPDRWCGERRRLGGDQCRRRSARRSARRLSASSRLP